jgi:acyl-CoA synthetase (AMP-forming)/AMP-acid ligase II
MNQMERSFNEDFNAIVTIYGERTALIPVVDGQKSLTYEQLNNLVQKHLAWFKSQGLKPGDRIGALIPNSVEMLTLFVACLRGGLGFAPLACDTSAAEAEKWGQLIRPSLVVIGEILPTAVIEGLEKSKVPTLQIKNNGDFAYLPDEGEALTPAEGAKIYLYTSGTTGAPKAMVLDGNRLWSSGYTFIRQHGFNFDNHFRMWNYLPQSYLGGLFNLCLIPMSVAGSIVVDESFSGKTFLSFWQTVDRFDLTALWFVPTIVRGLLAIGEKTKRYESNSYKDIIKIAFLGTAPIELATKEKFEEIFGIKLLENYALSETTFLTSEKAQDHQLTSEASVGRTLPYVELKFRSVAGDEDVKYQELMVKTPFLFDGYLNSENKVECPTQDGFFPTGDLGFIDDKGQVVISGRCKDIIKKGGQLISLREIEVATVQHAQVENAAAVMVNHPFYGESYNLYIKLKAGAEESVTADVKSLLYAKLAKYKWPDKILFVNEFPQTGSGKIRKFLLQGIGE